MLACSESLPEGTCDFEPPEHVPRTSARAQTWARGLGELPACHGAESTRKDPQPEEKKKPNSQKNTFIHGYNRHSVCSIQHRPNKKKKSSNNKRLTFWTSSRNCQDESELVLATQIRKGSTRKSSMQADLK